MNFDSFDRFDGLEPGDHRPEDQPRDVRKARIVDLWNELRPVLGPELSVLDEEEQARGGRR